MATRVSFNLRWRLSILWILEWGITGAIGTYLPLYFSEQGLSHAQLGQLMAVGAIGLWVAPLVSGQICDRYMSSEKYMAIAHFIGGMALISIPIATEIYAGTGENFSFLIFAVGLFAVAYFPTIPLASSLTFRHLPDPDTQFGSIRVWGTIGWVLAGFSLSLWLAQAEAANWLVATFPSCEALIDRIRESLYWLRAPESSDCFRISAVLSFALSTFCVFLPHTPPSRKAAGRIAPIETLGMFRDQSFTALIIVSFMLALVVPLYSLEVPKLLEQQGFQSDWIPALMTIGQISEFPALMVLHLCLNKVGLKHTFSIGMAAWLARYGLFSIGSPRWLVLVGVGLHGVCHVFLIIVVQLYVDARCRLDLRASAQNLFAFITMGIALPIGFVAGGLLAQWCADADGDINYHILFLLPACFIALLLIGFHFWFRSQPISTQREKDPYDQTE